MLCTVGYESMSRVPGRARYDPAPMPQEQFYYFYEMAQRPDGQRMPIALAIALPVGFALFFWAAYRRVHPLLFWLVLTGACVGMSQVYRENRPRLLEDLATAPVMAAAATWVWYRLWRRPRAADAPSPRA